MSARSKACLLGVWHTPNAFSVMVGGGSFHRILTRTITDYLSFSLQVSIKDFSAPSKLMTRVRQWERLRNKEDQLLRELSPSSLSLPRRAMKRGSRFESALFSNERNKFLSFLISDLLSRGRVRWRTLNIKEAGCVKLRSFRRILGLPVVSNPGVQVWSVSLVHPSISLILTHPNNATNEHRCVYQTSIKHVASCMPHCR